MYDDYDLYTTQSIDEMQMELIIYNIKIYIITSEQETRFYLIKTVKNSFSQTTSFNY